MKSVYIFLLLCICNQVFGRKVKVKTSPVCSNYIIGYGSLMNKESRESEDERLKILPSYFVNVKGFQRSFNYKCDHADNWLNDYAALGLVENPEKDFDGVMFCIPEGNNVFDSFDEREENYIRIKVETKSITCTGECQAILSRQKENLPNVYLYAIKPEMKKVFKAPTKEVSLSQSYIDVVMYGLLKDCKLLEGLDANNCQPASRFVETTDDWDSENYRNDRLGRTDKDQENLNINVRQNCSENENNEKPCFTFKEIDNIIIKNTKKNTSWKDKLFTNKRLFNSKTKRQLLGLSPIPAKKLRIR